MEIMNKEKLRLILAAGLVIVLMSCRKGDDPEPQLPDWNKNRTTTIQVYSRLNNAPLMSQGENDASPVSSRIRSAQHSVALLDRADVSLTGGSMGNPAVYLAAASQKVPLFSLNRFSAQTAEGNGVLIGHTYVRSDIMPLSGGTSFLKADTRANASIAMTFATVSFDASGQIDAGANAIISNITESTVVVGLVNKELVDLLKAKFSNPVYRFETLTSSKASASRAVYVVSSKKWILRETTESTVGNNGISVFDLQIEAL